jgi:hypothetical protein
MLGGEEKEKAAKCTRHSGKERKELMQNILHSYPHDLLGVSTIPNGTGKYF